MPDRLDESRRFWDAHARRDPLWAVLSEAGKDERRWDVQRFFQTGIHEIALVLYELESHGVHLERRDALDFGCGVGRLTQALAARFERVVGVDVSQRMIEIAAGLSPFGDRVSFVWNTAPHLARFGDRTFDFVYSNLVLQHVAPEVTVAYLRELVRILQPGGALVFQLPSHERGADDPVPQSIAIAMPDEAYQAVLVVANPPPGSVGPGDEITVDVDVTNASGLSWSQRDHGLINVGNHWLDQTASDVLQRDDGRSALPETVPPGSTCRVSLTVRTPSAEGDYVCEIDVAHEGARWFCDRSSSVARFPVRVRAGAAAAAHAAPDDACEPTPENAVNAGMKAESVDSARMHWPPVAPGDPTVENPGDFPMHGIHTDVIRRLIADCGAELVQRTLDHSCGREWISYRYYVRKPAGGESSG